MAARLTIVGTGLIGTSFALASRAQFAHISALDPCAEHARAVLAAGIVDAVVEQVPEADDAVFLACPSDRIADWLTTLAEHTGTVFDAGSVKGAIVAEVERRLGALPANYVPCHPIAGRELSGPQAADPALFRSRTVILTPTARTDAARRAQVTRWWQAAGANVIEMDPFEHDRVYALTSHLPHLLAFAYLACIEPEHLGHTGGGFRDFSRIGASDAEMWSAIFDCNRDALLPWLAEFRGHLDEFERAIVAGDRAACHALILDARARRSGLADD